MSLCIKIENISDENKSKIENELTIEIEASKYAYGAPPKYIIPYEIDEEDNYIYLPFSYACRNIKIERPKRESFPQIDSKFEGILRPHQQQVRKEAIKILNKKGSVLLSMYCGFGKSITSINLACGIGMKTLIIVNKIILMKQWEESIKDFTSSSVQKLTVKSYKKDCDFYIINAINVSKMQREFFSDIGCVIVDECHLIMAEMLSKSLQYVSPRYLIGLSATPYRSDGLNILLDLYFGTDKIIRKLYKEHVVYKVTTGFVPNVELAKNGKVNWGSVLDSQANDENRNQIILNIIQHFNDRSFLVLTKRISQGQYLFDRLTELGEEVTSLLGSQQEYKHSARILIGTCQKVGVGFDHPKLDTLLLAGDLEEYFIQYLGRCFRRPDVKPVIFDLVDNYSLLKRHFATRQAVYNEHGGKIKNFDMSILN